MILNFTIPSLLIKCEFSAVLICVTLEKNKKKISDITLRLKIIQRGRSIQLRNTTTCRAAPDSYNKETHETFFRDTRERRLFLRGLFSRTGNVMTDISNTSEPPYAVMTFDCEI